MIEVVDLPVLDLGSFGVDPDAELNRLRPFGQLARSLRGVEVLSHNLAEEVFRDPRFRTSSRDDYTAQGATSNLAEFVEDGVLPFLPLDRHRRVRKVFARPFAVRRIAQHRSVMDEVGERLLGELLEAGRGEMVGEFTERFSAEVLCRLLGIPVVDLPKFVGAALELRRMVLVPLEPHIHVIENSLNILHDYAETLLNERRRFPQDDFVSAFIDAEKEEGKLTPNELIWGVVNLLLAGIDTTTYQLASALQAFVVHEVWDRLWSEPEMIPAALQEAQRLAPVATSLARVPNEDLVLDGVHLPAGQNVRINLVAAGRDPDSFERPTVFDIDRPFPIFALGFGAGVHRCIGETMAWQDMVVATELLTSRLEHVTIDGFVEMHLWSDTLFGPAVLPMRFEKRSALDVVSE